jgi:hypothetical protein
MVMPLRVAWSSVSDLTVNEVGANEEERRPIGAMLAADDTGERTDMTTVICLDDFHSNDRNGRKESGLTALNPLENNFD